MANNKVLSIEITNDSVTIVEVSTSKKQTYVHDVAIFDTPEGSFEDGFIRDKDIMGSAIREQLKTKGINNKNVIFNLASTKIVNREVVIPAVAEKKVAGIINSNASEYFPVNIEDYVIAHSVLETIAGEEGKNMRVMVVAAPQQMIRTYYDLASVAGLHVQSIDCVGNAMLQMIKTQTAANSTTMVVQIGSEATILNIVNGDTLLLQRTVPYGINATVAEVMEEKEVDAATALTMLQTERMITVDFDDDAVTGSLRYLINNIGRVMDYYSSRNPDKPIDDVYLTGDGALVRGIDGLFKIQLNVATKVMDSLYNVTFDEKINKQMYNPVYLISAIGATYAPMGFMLKEQAEKAAGKGTTAIFIVIFVIAVIASVAMCVVSWLRYTEANLRKADLERKIAEIQDIEQIYNNYLTAQGEYNEVLTMYDATKISNEYMREFWETLEDLLPTDSKLETFSSSSGGVTFSVSSQNYDSIARFVRDLNDVDCVENVFINGIGEEEEETGVTYVYTVTCNYILPEYEAATTAAPQPAVVQEESEEEI